MSGEGGHSSGSHHQLQPKEIAALMADFDKELHHTMFESKTAHISASRISSLTKNAFKHAKLYKNVVHSIEKAVTKCSAEHKLSCLYVIDAIVRAAPKALSEADAALYINRFQDKLESMFPHMLSAPTKDKEKMKRLIQLWKKNNIFNSSMLSNIESAYFPDIDIGDSATPTTAQVTVDTATAATAAPPVDPTLAALPPETITLLNTIAASSVVSNPASASALLPLLQQSGLLPPGEANPMIMAALAGGVNPLTALYSGLGTSDVAAVTGGATNGGGGAAKAARKASDFDYGDDDEDPLRKPGGSTNRPAATPEGAGTPNLANSPLNIAALAQLRSLVAPVGGPPPVPPAGLLGHPHHTPHQDMHDVRSRDPRQRDPRDHRGGGDPRGRSPPRGGMDYRDDGRYAPRDRSPPRRGGGPPPPPSSSGRRRDRSWSPRERDRSPPYGGRRGGRSRSRSRSRDRGGGGGRRDRSRSRDRSPPSSWRGRGGGGGDRGGGDRRRSWSRERRGDSRDRGGPPPPARSPPRHAPPPPPPPVVPQVPPGPECQPAKKDPSVPEDYIKILTRTIYVGGVVEPLSRDRIKEAFSQYGRVDTCFANLSKANAFVKMMTREEGEKAYNAMYRSEIDGISIKLSWGCGFGPKDLFDYDNGDILMKIDELSEMERRWISKATRGGGPVEGGTVVEEPNVEGGWRPTPRPEGVTTLTPAPNFVARRGGRAGGGMGRGWPAGMTPGGGMGGGVGGGGEMGGAGFGRGEGFGRGGPAPGRAGWPRFRGGFRGRGGGMGGAGGFNHMGQQGFGGQDQPQQMGMQFQQQQQQQSPQQGQGSGMPQTAAEFMQNIPTDPEAQAAYYQAYVQWYQSQYGQGQGQGQTEAPNPGSSGDASSGQQPTESGNPQNDQGGSPNGPGFHPDRLAMLGINP